MLDCLSNGRLISGFVRGIPREYLAYGVNLAESRSRFEEAWNIVKRAWTEDVFSYEGKYWSYKDVSIWPRPLQKPHPVIWMPVSVSKESIEWAAKENIPITPGAINNTLPVRKDMVRYYSECLERNGYSITPGHIAVGASVYVADSRQDASRRLGRTCSTLSTPSSGTGT
jgi:alkanesulfonate monooxygenase SsuD/methylene tetrahydromethanopterin reductase-like flavin-dependent oxidoreductase (luciferase family)